MHTCDPSVWETGQEDLRLEASLGYINKTPAQKKIKRGRNRVVGGPFEESNVAGGLGR